MLRNEIMRTAVRAIIIKDNNLLVMHRNKFGNEYLTLVGGGVELNETKEQALVREVIEETSITITNPRLVFIENGGELYGLQYIYLCDHVLGEPVLSTDSIEYKINQQGKNIYTPTWVSLDELDKHKFLSIRLKKAILDGVVNGFPSQAIELVNN